MYIAMPNRNYTTVCILSPCNKVICSLSFREHCTIISAPCIAADTGGFLYHSSPIKVLPHLYLDFCKEFDCVPHQCVLFKLKAYGISGNVLYWIMDFLSNS